MEHHDAVYEQSYEINSSNQGAEYISSHEMVQEIVVHNESNQQPTVNCEMSGIEIMLPNDCINVQDQCNSNIILASNMDNNYTHEKQVSNDVSQINNLEGDISGYNQSHTEVHEQFTIQNSTNYQESYETGNTVVLIQNEENDNKEFSSENSISNNEQVTQVKVVESASSLPDNQTVNTLAGDLNDNQEVSYVETESNSKGELVSSSVVEESIEPMDIDSMSTVTSTVVNDNIIVESYNQSQNHCEEIIYPNNSDSNYSEVNVQPKLSESAELLITESSVKEITVVTNSDDVATLIEFNSTTEACQKNHNEPEELVHSNVEEVDYHTEPIEQKYFSVKSEAEKTPSKTNSVDVKNADDTTVHEDVMEDDDDLDVHLSSQTSENQRKVIQDIFDDWQDENNEDDNNQAEHQDSVELELQNLLNDGAQDTSSITESTLNNFETYPNPNKSNETTPVKQKVIKQENSSATRRSSNRSPKPVHNSSKEQSHNRSKSHDHPESKSKFQSPRPGVKVPGHHLTSQIASTAEVNEVLKERLREKQKDLVTPKTADLVFVKKITARLSSKLAGAVTGNVPPIIPPSISQNEGDKSKLDKSVESSKTTVTDSKELLAILEGDDDPDWTDLKGAEENSKTASPGDSHGSKLNPVLEKELALKQLQELPSLPTKKGSPGVSKKTKKTSKSKEPEDPLESSNSVDEKAKADAASSAESGEEDAPKKDGVSKSQKENIQNDSVEINVEESRSGRKRKLTEKARQHELSVKRQKTTKGKATEAKKQESSQDASEVAPEEPKPASPKPDQTKSDATPSKTESKAAKPESKQSKSTTKSESGDENTVEAKTPAGKKPAKQLGVSKKDSRISKRKLAVKNLMRKKLAGQKTSTKGKIQTEPLTKDDTPSKPPAEKSSPGGATVRPKKTSEIDKLLQDEGVVNLLYDVEQPDSRRLVPITKSQKKVMDVDKAERELKLRTKLVRNAVMRLRNSAGSTIKISPRSRRSAVPSQQTSPQEKKAAEPAKSPKTSASVASTSDFTLPGKAQRNAADASRIIRRHSSSSFSSASASPRVSVDMPPESMKLDFPELQGKTKRKNLQNSEEKKTKKKSISKTDESDDESKTKKESPVKKSKSNAGATAAKNKKVPKSRSSLDSNSGEARARSPEKITACLAEAASALSTFNSRSSNAANRKKGTSSPEADDESLDFKKLSSYKEIVVKQHGHLVQLILTPSSTTSGIRNAITIQVMKELREALLIMKKHDDCRVVLLTSTGTSFCEGLDVSYLVSSNKEERKRRAEEMAKTIKSFIKTLAEFNKPIVAGVQGAAVGLGVTMLPLFDLVVASDKATFSTPYAKLGQIAEGAAVLTLSHSLGTAVTNELLLGGRTLTASEALRAGLVTRVLWPDKFSSELLPSLKSMSEQSSQSMEATKALLRRSLRKQLDVELESETFLLIEHWYSSECQEAIQAYIEDKGQ